MTLVEFCRSSKVTILVVGLLVTISSLGQQHTNSISFEATSRIYTNYGELMLGGLYIGDQFGLQYERKIKKRGKVSVGFTRWTNFLGEILLKNISGIGGVTIGPFGENIPNKVGDVWFRYNYNMTDVSYRHVLYESRRSEMKAGLGISCAWGRNVYIDSGTVRSSFYKVKPKTDAYLGIVPSLSYDCKMLRNRIFVGADLRYRKYFGMYAQQLDYGLHAGVRF